MLFLIGFILIIFSLLIRLIQFKKFIKNISIICHMYDWKIVDEEPEKLLQILKEDYYMDAEWSAYNFLFLKGPSPLAMFFSFKKLSVYNFYDLNLINKIKIKVVGSN